MPLITSDLEFSDDYPTIEPSLKLDFANARALDPRITFTRESVATYVGSNGLIETVGNNEPRFDHDPTTGESLGLLIEESRTNFFENSETVGGTATGDFFRGKEIHNKTVNINQLYFASDFANYNIQAGDVYTLTGFIRAGSQTGNILIRWIDALNAPVSGVNNFSYTPTTDGEFVSFEFTFSQAFSGSCNCALTGSSGDDADFAIMQLEKGFFPTSYIPTSGSTVTRQIETMSLSGSNFSSWNNQSEGTYIMSIKNNSTNISGLPSPARTQSIFLFLGNGGHFTKNLTSNVQMAQLPVNTTDYRKWAFYHHGANGYGMCINGNTPTESSQPIGTSDTSIIFNDIQGQTSFYLKSLFYYPKRLTNAQLQALTQ